MSDNPVGTGTVQEATEALLALSQPTQENPTEATEVDTEVDTTEESIEEPSQESEQIEIEDSTDELPETDIQDNELEEQTPTYTVKVNGQDVEVTEQELRAGYSRQGDYTRKTLELAEERRTLEASQTELTTSKAEIGQIRQQYSERLDLLEAALNKPAKSPEELQRILSEDGAEEYSKIQLQEQQRLNSLNAIQTERKKLQEQDQAQQQVDWDKYVQNEGKRLTSIMPKFSDQQSVKQLSEYLTNQGFTAQEVGSTADHRYIMIAEKARMWDQLQGKKARVDKKVANAPKVLKPGVRKSKQDPQDQKTKETLSRLRKSGSVRDAAAAFHNLKRSQ